MNSVRIRYMKIQHQDLPITMRKLITASPYTYAELESRSGVPQRYIKRFRTGDIDDLSMDHTLKLCTALGIRATFSTRG